MQNRLGPLAYDLTRVGAQLSVFSDLSRQAGGGLEQGRTALENMYTFVQRMGPAWQIALAGGAGVGGTGLEQWWQMQRWLAGFGGAEFQRAVPQMFTELLRRFGFAGDTLGAIYGLSQMGISTELLAIAQRTLEHLRERGVPEEQIYEKMVSELSASKEFQEASKKQLVDLGDKIKETLTQQIPAIQQALNSIILLLQGLFNLVAALINAVVGYLKALSGGGPSFSEVGGWLGSEIGKIWTTQIKPATKGLEQAGLAVVSSIFSAPWMPGGEGGGGVEGVGKKVTTVLSSEQIGAILGIEKKEVEEILTKQGGLISYSGGATLPIVRAIKEALPTLKALKADVKYERGKVLIEVNEHDLDTVTKMLNQSKAYRNSSPLEQ